MSTERTDRGRIVAAMSDNPTSDFDQPAENLEPVEGQPTEPDRPQTLEQQKEQRRRELEGDTGDEDETPA
jgi:hypothetical protein